MTQVIEYIKLEGTYLVYHFEFARNENLIGDHFCCSLNKYMSLHDWQLIYTLLSDSIKVYLEDPQNDLAPKTISIEMMNIELNVTWIKFEPIYFTLTKIDRNELVYPYVMNVTVSALSNINQFLDEKPPPDIPLNVLNSVKNTKVPIILREAYVKLSKLRIEDYLSTPGTAKNTDIENGSKTRLSVKRTFASLEKEKEHYRRSGASLRNGTIANSTFAQANSSSPFINGLHEIERDVSRISINSTQIVPNRKIKRDESKNISVESTPVPAKGILKSRARKVRPLILAESFFNATKSSKRDRKVRRKTITKKISSKKTVPSATQRITKRKRKIPPILNDSDVFDEKTAKKAVKKTKAASTKTEQMSIKDITLVELMESFKENFDHLQTMFNDYQKSNEVKNASDYDHIDIISLLQSDHIQHMLDILYNNFVNVTDHGSTSFTNLFFELMVPEWSLAIFMKKYSLNREAAVEQICNQRICHTDETQSTISNYKLNGNEC